MLGELVFASVEKIDDAQRLKVEANVAYSHIIIVAAAKKVQAWPSFANDEKVKKCKFSPSWVYRWLRETDLRRRRVTTSAKTLPPPDQVQSQLREIQERLQDFTLDEVISADETGFFYCVAPLNQYVPESAERAVSPAGDEKARITAMLWGTAAGNMGPEFVIIKCSSKSFDLTKTRVLTALHTLPGFTATDGWSLKVWVKTLSLKVKKVDKDFEFKIPYLIHTDLSIITIQHRAWMDTCRVCMWVELQLGPFYEKKRGRCALIWDNCGPHGVAATKAICNENGVFDMPLPKNMTNECAASDGPHRERAHEECCQEGTRRGTVLGVPKLEAQPSAS